MTYVTCGYSTCRKFNAEWFKIDQIGNKSDGGYTYQRDVGYPWPLTIYHQLDTDLVRNEIIALYLVVTPGGGDFYPPLHQDPRRQLAIGPANQTILFLGTVSARASKIQAYTLGAAVRVEPRASGRYSSSSTARKRAS